MPEVTNSIQKTIQRFYGDDLCALLKREIKGFGARFTDVDPEGEKRMAKRMSKAGGVFDLLSKRIKETISKVTKTGSTLGILEQVFLETQAKEEDPVTLSQPSRI
jgi:hypothetical protein